MTQVQFYCPILSLFSKRLLMEGISIADFPTAFEDQVGRPGHEDVSSRVQGLIPGS